MIDSTTTTHRQIRYRLLPGSVQRALHLRGLAEACRFTWNEILFQHNAAYEKAREAGEKPPSTSFFSLGVAFTKLRAKTPWMPQYSYKLVRATLKYQAEAWTRFFRGQGGAPNFKPPRRTTPSITIPEEVKIKDGKLHVEKLGWLRIQRRGGNPYPDGIPKKAVIRQECGKWYVTVCYEIPVPPKTENPVAVGLDMNVGQVAMSTGRIFHAPKAKRLEAKKKRYERKLARHKKGSHRRWKTKLKLQKVQRAIAATRKNWCHGVSCTIARDAGTVVIEDLRIQNMTATAKGTIEEPGVNVKAKAGLNREILATGWGLLKQLLEYKVDQVLVVDPKYTSQTCRTCGHVAAENRRRTTFSCVACGHTDHADVNAALNILASGIGATARREALPRGTSMTREKARRRGSRKAVHYS